MSRRKRRYADLPDHLELDLDSVYGGLLESARALASDTKDTLRKHVASVDTPGKYKPAIQGVKAYGDKYYGLAVVTIMRDFRLKWYERGTAERVRKNGGRTGRIKACWFFAEAKQGPWSEKFTEFLNRVKLIKGDGKDT